jgi:HJR/Mrr/RecB family endonuclease
MFKLFKKHPEKKEQHPEKKKEKFDLQSNLNATKARNSERKVRKMGWKKISNMDKSITEKNSYLGNLYYDGFVTNAPYEDRYWSAHHPDKPEHKYSTDSYSHSHDQNKYIKAQIQFEYEAVYEYDRFYLGPHFELLPFDELGSIDIPPLPKLPKVSDIVYKDNKDNEYSFLDRLKENHKEASELLQQKKEQFQNIKDEIDSRWDELQSNFSKNPDDNLAIEDYLIYILKRHLLPYFFKNDYKVKLDSKASTLIVQFPFPDYDRHQFVIDEYKSSTSWDRKYKYASQTQSKKIIEANLYSLIIRSAYICSKYLPDEHGKIIVINVEQHWFDPSTGHLKSGIIASVQGKKEFFTSLNTVLLDPKECFKSLKGLSTKSLKNTSPIRPIMSLDKDDPRLVEGKDLNLDDGTNLAAMPWEDFEHLVAQIFELEFSKSGVEVKVTQVSRDRGVDAILFDPDPLKGGKYVLQAKRYTRTVDVASVRDLYGTVVNEGANRGILITTSSYGPDAYEFAKDKPITLIDGSNLLSIFEKHQMNYRIDLEEARLLNLDNDS